MEDRIIIGQEREEIETQMELEANVQKGFAEISKIENGVKYYRITKKGEKHLKTIGQ